MSKQKVLVCTKGKTCRKRGAKKVFCALERQIIALGLDDAIRLRKVDCLGHCGVGPTVKLKGKKTWFENVSPAGAREIIGTICRNFPIR